MNATLKNNICTYHGGDYSFQFKNEKEQFYNTLIVAPKHLKVLYNTTGLTTTDLKNKIIKQWFAEENEAVRQHNNLKSRERRAKCAH